MEQDFLNPLMFGGLDGFPLGDVDADQFTDLLLFEGAWARWRRARGVVALAATEATGWGGCVIHVLTPPCADLLGPPGTLPPMPSSIPTQGAYEYGGPRSGGVHQHNTLSQQGVQPGGGLGPYDLVSHAMVRGCATAATCPALCLNPVHAHVLQAQYAHQQTSFDGMRPAIGGSFTAMMGDAELTERCLGVSTPAGAAAGEDGKKRRNAAQERRGARSTSKYRGVTHHCRTGRCVSRGAVRLQGWCLVA